MQNDNEIDELVEKAIDETLVKSDSEEELEKRKPKPFRYLNKKEIKAEISNEELVPVSVMKETTSPQIVEDKYAVLGLGDIESIENVLKKFKVSRKIK